MKALEENGHVKSLGFGAFCNKHHPTVLDATHALMIRFKWQRDTFHFSMAGR